MIYHRWNQNLKHRQNSSVPVVNRDHGCQIQSKMPILVSIVYHLQIDSFCLAESINHVFIPVTFVSIEIQWMFAGLQ